jgi:signal transduction histidine kinase
VAKNSSLVRSLLLAATIALCLFLVVVGVAWPFIQMARSNLHNQTRSELVSLAQSAALLVDPKPHRALSKPGAESTETYRKAIEPLSRFQAAHSEVAFVYTLIHRERGIFFVLDPTPPGRANADGVELKSYPMDPYDDAPADARMALRSQTAIASREPTSDAWGTFLSGFAPLRDEKGEIYGVIGVDMEASAYLARYADIDRNEQILFTLAFVASFVAAMISLTGSLGSRRNGSELDEALDSVVGLREAQAAVINARKGRDVFIASLIADFMMPLSSLAQTGNRLITETDDPFLQSQINVMIGQTEHLRDLLKEARDLAHLEASEAAFPRSPVNPALELNFALSQAVGQRKFQGRRLNLETAPELSTMARLPLDRLRQMLSTMIEAVAAGTNGDVLISGISENRSGVVWMTVEVSGSRFGWNPVEAKSPEDGLEHAMQGVIARRVAQMLGGTIHVENTAAQLIWRLQLPLPPSNLWVSAA